MKRILCMLLALCMVLSFMPRTAAAQEGQQETTLTFCTTASAVGAEKGKDSLDAQPALDEFAPSGVRENRPAEVSLVLARWISSTAGGDEIDGDLRTGVRYYYNFEIFDEVSGTYLDDLADVDYTVYLAIYNPSGNLVQSGSFSRDSGSISFTPSTAGQYRFTWSITGDINGSNSFYRTVIAATTGTADLQCDPSSLALEVGDSDVLTVWLTGSYSGSITVSWDNSNSSVATCEWGQKGSDGKLKLHVRALSAGTTTITLEAVTADTEAFLDRMQISVTVTEQATNTYSIVFVVNGGTGTPATITAAAGSTVTLPSTIPQSNTFGVSFSGWETTDDSGDFLTFYPGGRLTLNRDMVLIANWLDPMELDIYSCLGSSTVRTDGQYVNFPNQCFYYCFNPGATSSFPITYRFEGIGSGDSRIYLYNASGTQLDWDDDDGDGNLFLLDYTFRDNNRYFIKICFYGDETGDLEFGISCLTEATCNHTFGSWTVTTQPTCTVPGVETRTCTQCGYSETREVPVTSHTFGSWSVTTQPTCTEPGVETRTCTLCGYTETREVPALDHDYQNGECIRCHEPDPNAPALDGVIRLAGSNRYATGFAIANQLKELMGVSQFQAVVIAYGLNFPDALTGSYLASVKNAPILLTDPSVDTEVLEYLKYNLASGGDVYILGGEAAVSRTFEVAANAMGFNVERLKGSGRYETNLAILREAGINSEDEILIATGKNYADSLSASATGLPMLLVDKTLTDSQREFLRGTSGRFVILGGTGAVSAEVEAELNRIGTAIRVKGSNRYLTSVLIANRYFSGAQAAVLAYAQGFPDGLCGGPLAMCLGAPLILTSNDNPDAADGYIRDISCGAVTGGTGRISDDTVREIFDLPYNTPIPKQ